MGMNLHDQEQLARIAQNWRLTPATLATKLTNGGWIAAPWLKYASTRIASGIARGGARIILSAPPRHGKSELVSVHTPTWVLENFPNKNVILAAYGADLAEGYGRRVRDQIRDKEDLLRCRVRPDVSKVGAFLTETNGYMYSVGLGGAITGRGAHVLLIDDYIKEIKEALSPAHRDYVWNWFVTTAMTRLEPGASVIIIATRWHSDDLIGRILKNFPGQWENIVLPALALENDILGRAVGAPLFEERFDTAFLEGQRDLLGSVFFHALYQQGPVDEILKFTNPSWLKPVFALPEASDWKWARVWDLAATEDGGDYTCGTLSAYSKSLGQFIIANVIRKQISIGDVETLVKNTAAADGEDVTVGIEQEPGSSGKGLVEHYQKTVLPEYKVVAVPATKQKLVRAQPMLAAAEAGKVYLLDETVGDYSAIENVDATWHKHFVSEFETFPGGENDDQVDTAAAGFVLLSGRKVYTASWGRKRGDDGSNKRNSKKIRQASFIMSNRGRSIGHTFGRRKRAS
jgi:predicted phage terminase large subunit-like protein